MVKKSQQTVESTNTPKKEAPIYFYPLVIFQIVSKLI